MRRCAPAEAARSMLTAGATLELQREDFDQLVSVGGYGTDPAGRLLLPVAADNRLVTAAEEHGDVPVRGTVTDVAPLPLRRRVRGRLCFLGWAEPLEPGAAELAWQDATCACSPLGDGQRLVRIEPAELVLERDEQPPAEIDLGAFAEAAPDPLASIEAELLQHLAHGHPEALAALVSQLPRGLRKWMPQIVPWRLDRHQLVLRVQRHDDDVDVAFALPDPGATCAREVLGGLRQVIDGRCHDAGKDMQR